MIIKKQAHFIQKNPAFCNCFSFFGV